MRIFHKNYRLNYTSSRFFVETLVHLANNITLSLAVNSATNLGVIFDSNLTFSENTFLLFLNHLFIVFVTSDAFKILLIILQPVLLPLVSFILNVTIVTILY
jgi:hypothetical protein